MNIELLREAVEWAEAEASKPFELCEWEQEAYVTPNNIQEAYRRFFQRRGETPTMNTVYGRLALKAPECGTCYCIAGYICRDMTLGSDYSRMAGERLGLHLFNLISVYRLFDERNTIEDIRRIAEEIAGEKL